MTITDTEIRPRAVVTIDQGTRTFEILRIEEGMARIAPTDPADDRDADWVSVGRLHIAPEPNPVPFTVTWTEVSTHSATMSSTRLAALLGIPVQTLLATQQEDMAGLGDLANSLCELDDAGPVNLTREDITITKEAQS